MIPVRPPFFYRWLSPGYLVCSMPGAGKVIYLTFDDGPVPDVTPEVLSILKKFGAKATFFVVGDNVKKHPDVFEMVRQDGHSVGNHTFHHLNGWKTPPGAYIDDVRQCRDYTGSRLFRPPYGRFTPTQYILLHKEYRFILWSVLTGDYSKSVTPEKCLENAIDNAHDGSVVVFHDHLKAIEKVRYALPRFLEHFSGLGYEFRSLEKLNDGDT
jgi:peptidoglycan-N-acetylglucosamine deacetylase